MSQWTEVALASGGNVVPSGRMRPACGRLGRFRAGPPPAVALACTVVVTLLVITGGLRGVPAETLLTAEQEATARSVEGQVMSPCCFGGTIATHHSPTAEEFRAEIRSMAAQGMTEAQILEHYLEVYGERILAQPVARGFNALAYWMPAVALLCGAGLVTFWLLRRRSGPPVDAAPPRGTQEDDAAARRLHEQFEKELAAFDA